MRLSTRSLSSVSTKSFFVGLVIAGAAAAFVFVGFNPSRGGGDANTAARVGSQTISMRTLSQRVDNYNRQSGEKLDDARKQANLQSALTQLIEENVLIEEGIRYGWDATKIESAQWIRNVAQFQDPKTNQFDIVAYKKFIKSGQMSELDLYQVARQSVVRQKVDALLQLPAYLPSTLVAQAQQRDETAFELEYVELKPSADAIKAAAAEEAKTFEKDEKNLPELQKLFESSKSEFNRRAQVQVKSILIAHMGATRATGDAAKRSVADAEKIAQETLKKLQSGESIEKLSGTLNDDQRAKAAKSDLGFIDETTIDADTAKAATSLSAAKPLSDVVKTPFGFRLLKWVSARPATSKKFEDVKGELALRMVSPSVSEKLKKEIAVKINDAAAKNDLPGLEKVMKEQGLSWQKLSKPFTPSSQFIEGIGISEPLQGVVFNLKKPNDITAKAGDFAGRSLIFKLVSRKESTVAKDEKKLADFQRMKYMQASQQFTVEAQKKLFETYTRDKEIERNSNLLK